MTDNEIIKALERVKKNPTLFSLEDMVMIRSLDLINRQKAEIERLQKSLNNMTDALIKTDEVKTKCH